MILIRFKDFDQKNSTNFFIKFNSHLEISEISQFQFDQPFHAVHGRVSVGICGYGNFGTDYIQTAFLQSSQWHLLSIWIIHFGRVNFLSM